MKGYFIFMMSFMLSTFLIGVAITVGMFLIEMFSIKLNRVKREYLKNFQDRGE